MVGDIEQFVDVAGAGAADDAADAGEGRGSGFRGGEDDGGEVEEGEAGRSVVGAAGGDKSLKFGLRNRENAY